MMTDYKADLNERYWKYQKSRFPNEQRFFDRLYAQDGRPPVFITSESCWPKRRFCASALARLLKNGERFCWRTR